jgi:predicted CXXCH cytochrome family protein
VEAAGAVKYKHQPVQKGCVTCHEAHGSAAAPALLKRDVPALCVGCHKMDSPILTRKHLGYPVKSSRCTTCHDPHGSDKPGMFLANVHPPVAKGQCAMCHEPATSKTPFKTKQVGADLCRTCHSQKMAAQLDRNRVHQPVAEGACLACHGPHASKDKGLLKGNAVAVCGECHADTIRRQAVSVTKHKPVGAGECHLCHDPHGGSAPLYFLTPNGIEMCGKCHDWQQHSTHPIGDKVKDPRNPNLVVQCSSCHRAHGSEYKHMIPLPNTSLMCTDCHDRFKR